MKKNTLFLVAMFLFTAVHAEEWRERAAGFHEVDRGSGFRSPAAMIEFIDQVEGELVVRDGMFTRFVRDPSTFLDETGMVWTVLLILLGGLALNLTPCVLPMIPVNLAIIGAGSQSPSRLRGFILGGLYGVGIAAVYGLLGLVAVFGGGGFGALNASPWFNLAIAALFIALALGMFGVFTIDLSRFQKGGAPRSQNRYLAALAMGGVAALLAGACVAPVVLAVLLLAGRLFADGVRAGLLLPFLLGAGMALPWPLAGAGFSVLPKPGRWMGAIKVVFGVLILLLALYYGRLGVHLLQRASQTDDVDRDAAGQLLSAFSGTDPVFLYFTADWCAACKQLERDTWPDEAVQTRLEPYHFVTIDATHFDEPPIPGILEHFEVLGLPTWIVLRPGG